MNLNEEKRIFLIILLWIGTWSLIDIFMFNIKNYYLKIFIYLFIICFSYLYLKKLRLLKYA